MKRFSENLGARGFEKRNTQKRAWIPGDQGLRQR